ncbi:MAG: DUF5666 domain-containing protein, partial [Acidobacteriota bacterium]|nr:DUF5666 domain-containing protein [Acidobacteriota bacterium]
VLMMIAALLALVSCQGRENADDVTSTYGGAVLRGQVVMTDGSSPADVTVTVRGTGLRTILEADGVFAFAGAPQDARLDFDRASDGVAASLRVASGSGALVVELDKTAAKTGKRRGAGSASGVKAIEIEGLVRSASATKIVVFSSKGVEETIAIAAGTVIRKGKTTIAAADLAVDTRVHVKASRGDAGLSAILVLVQNDEEDEEKEKAAAREFEGTVVSVTATQLVLTDSRAGEVTFVLNASTVIRKGSAPIAATDIKPGMRVHVKATASADGATKTATLVLVQETRSGEDEVRLSGTITAIGGTTLTVKTETSSVTVQTDASTRIEKAGKPATLAGLNSGDRVKVEGKKSGENSVLATQIEVR